MGRVSYPGYRLSGATVMDRYALVAIHGSHVNGHVIKADNSKEAAWEAISYIMDKANADKTGAWALGEIKLYAPDGSLLHHMEAK